MKNVLIIGGNSDIGFSLGKIFAKSNYKIILTSKDFKELETKKLFFNNSHNGSCDIYKFDVENDDILDLLNKINEKIDIIYFQMVILKRLKLIQKKL